jgi:DNA-binding IclR family transcriptional regulator
MGAEGHADGTVGKALDVLDMVASHGRAVRFSDLMAQSDYPKATLYRLLQTLTHQGMLVMDPDQGTYALGVRLVRLAHAAWAQSSLAPIARPYLDELAEKTGETIHLAQLDLGQVLYVDKRNAARPVEMFAQAGKVGPAYCTGVGKAMLAWLSPEALEAALARQSFHPHTGRTLDTPEKLIAELQAIRACGHAFDREEHEAGIICCAVPILTRSGRVLGALSVTSTTARTTLEALEAQSGLTKDIAAKIAAEAESWRFPEQNQGGGRSYDRSDAVEGDQAIRRRAGDPRGRSRR